MSQAPDRSSRPAPPGSQQDVNLLIADVAALTDVPAPQLRSWEDAGLIHPRRSPNGVRLYDIEEVARVRLIKRSLQNPGRRGSLRRLSARLASGDLVPGPEDYAGLVDGSKERAPLPDVLYWQAVVDSVVDLVVVCNMEGQMTSMNPALRTLLAHTSPERPVPPVPPSRWLAGEPLPPLLAVLPLHWAARTGTQHRDVEVEVPGPDGTPLRTAWTVTSLRDTDGVRHGAIGVGRVVPHDDGNRSEDWLATAAHDLRSPVTTILGRVELARREAVASHTTPAHIAASPSIINKMDMHLAMAERGIFDLIRTMDTVLDSAAMSNGRLIQQFHPAATALDRLVREAVEHVQSQSSRHTLTVELPPVPLLVSGDRVRLRHVLDNLLANAVKYSPDGGAILVRLEAVEAPPTMLPNPPLALPERTPGGPHWALLRVKDEGLGIPAEAVPHVFERYWRADGPTRLIPGTGLGLFACSMIVAAHGGHIWVEESIPAMDLESEPSRPHGTTMALVLPLATLPGGAAAAIDGLNGQDHAAAQDEDEIDGERGEIDGK